MIKGLTRGFSVHKAQISGPFKGVGVALRASGVSSENTDFTFLQSSVYSGVTKMLTVYWYPLVYQLSTCETITTLINVS